MELLHENRPGSTIITLICYPYEGGIDLRDETTNNAPSSYYVPTTCLQRGTSMDTDFITLASFVVITTFTPGPNNISSASMGILYGYRKTLPYLAGIVSGFFLVMLLCGLISSTLLRILPGMENILRYLGAVYILWLAYHTLKASYTFEEEQQVLMGFPQGFLLQLLNPKAIVYGLTLYSTFLSGIAGNPFFLVVSTVAVAIVAFAAISTWTLFGTAIRTYLNRPRVKQVLNIALSLLLAFTAVELSGVLDLIFT